MTTIRISEYKLATLVDAAPKLGMCVHLDHETRRARSITWHATAGVVGAVHFTYLPDRTIELRTHVTNKHGSKIAHADLMNYKDPRGVVEMFCLSEFRKMVSAIAETEGQNALKLSTSISANTSNSPLAAALQKALQQSPS